MAWVRISGVIGALRRYLSLKPPRVSASRIGGSPQISESQRHLAVISVDEAGGLFG